MATPSLVVANGTGKHLGSDVSWSFRWRGDGAFYEEVRSKHLVFKWGHDGGEGSTCWEVDPYGVSRHLECDDHEALLLAALVRSGCWTRPSLRARLELRLEEPGGSWPQVQARRLGGGGGDIAAAAPRRAATADAPGAAVGAVVAVRLSGGRMEARVALSAARWTPLGFTQPLCGETERWHFTGWRGWEADGVSYPALVAHHAYAGGQHIYRTASCQAVRPDAALCTYVMPLCARLPPDTTFDEAAGAEVQGWQSSSGHTLVAADLNGQRAGLFILDTGASGFVVERSCADRLRLERFGAFSIAAIAGKVQTRFRRARTLRIGPLTIRDPVLMEMPLAGIVKGAPSDVVGIIGYDVFRRAVVEIPGSNPAAVAAPPPPPSPALVAPASVPWPLSKPPEGGSAPASTRAQQPVPKPPLWGSGSVGVGVRPGLPAACAGGRAATSGGAAEPAGPSAHADVDAANLGVGAEGRPMSGRDASTSGRGAGAPAPAPPGARPVALLLRNPTLPAPPPGDWVWAPLKLIANLPHVELEFETEAGVHCRELFLVDSGAGGSDLMFHARAARRLGLLDGGDGGGGGGAKTRFVKGVGGSGQRTMRVQVGELAFVSCGGVRFDRVKALYAVHGGLDISLYSAGIVCGDLLARTSVVYDYVNRRLGLQRVAATAAAAAQRVPARLGPSMPLGVLGVDA